MDRAASGVAQTSVRHRPDAVPIRATYRLGYPVAPSAGHETIRFTQVIRTVDVPRRGSGSSKKPRLFVLRPREARPDDRPEAPQRARVLIRSPLTGRYKGCLGEPRRARARAFRNAARSGRRDARLRER